MKIKVQGKAADRDDNNQRSTRTSQFHPFIEGIMKKNNIFSYQLYVVNAAIFEFLQLLQGFI